MPNYIVYDPASAPVANLVTRNLKSFDGGREGELGASFLKNPDLSGIDESLPMLVEGGTTVRNLTQPELDSIEADREATRLASLKQRMKNEFRDNRDKQRVFTMTVAKILKQYVDYRADGNGALTLGQLNTQLQNEFDAQVDALS